MDENTQQRMQLINKMLLQMASGNFHFRIERSSHTDNTEALIVTLNMLAEEIQDTIVHQGYANTDTTVLDIVQMSFILDGRGVWWKWQTIRHATFFPGYVMMLLGSHLIPF